MSRPSPKSLLRPHITVNDVQAFVLKTKNGFNTVSIALTSPMNLATSIHWHALWWMRLPLWRMYRNLFAQEPLLTYLVSFRLYSKGRILGHKRAKRNSSPNTSLVQIEGVSNKNEAQFYLGKVYTHLLHLLHRSDPSISSQRVAYVYKAKREIQGSKIRVIWGRVTRSHGNSGVVKSKFSSNLPPRAFGAGVRIMLYPSNI
ncbi:translation protein [Chiua virens]|nr:translation protein [Chiua virens]